MKRKFTFLLAALLLMSGLTWAQEQVTDVLNRAFTGVENTSYASWTNTGTSGTAYAGQ